MINIIIVFSQEIEYNYYNGNGTIIEEKFENNKQIITRKHEDRFELYSINPGEGYRANGVDTLVLLDKPQLDAALIFSIPDSITWINTLLFRYEMNFDDDKKNSWLYVRTDDGKAGWLYVGINFDPYENGRWSILEIITIQNKIWTVRKLTGYLSVWKVLNVRDKPGLNNTTVLFNLIPAVNNPQLGVTILAITEEKDTIDGITDYWVKIKDEQNRIGWVFGGYTSVERGGPKYSTPNASIRFEYNFP
jgi:hypothetical protein